MPILTPEERLGTLLAGRYRIESQLGRGGMGVVLAGRHELTGRAVAIKLLLPNFVSDADLVARFFQEAKAAAALNHPNVVDVLDMGIEDGEAFLVLELLEGEPLADVLERGPVPAAELLGILLPVIDALAAAHEQGIVHRDLKPDNIFVHRDVRGRAIPKVLDFGIAKLLEIDSGVQTRTGGVLGTPHYMSPEQAQGKKGLGAESDVWSMGVLLYECLGGVRPFEAESVPALLLQICTTDPPPLHERALAVHPAISAAVHRALERNLGDRYASMEELGGALIAAAHTAGLVLPAAFDDLFPTYRETISPSSVQTQPGGLVTGPVLGLGGDRQLETSPTMAQVEPAPRDRSKAPLLVAVVSLLIALVGGVWFGLSGPSPSESGSDAPVETPGPEAPPPEAPPPEAPPPEAPAAILRTLMSDPTGAEVYVDGTLVGNTPYEVDLASAPGQRIMLEVRADGRRDRAVTLSADSSPEVLVSLPRVRRGRSGGTAPALAPR